MALKKSELYSSLWQSCDELRGGMDASQYKDYVLVLLFIKYITDRYADQPYAPITIPAGASFRDLVALKGKSDIGDQINKKIIAPLAAANKLSDMPDFNDAGKLGSDKEMVERLTNLIAIFENPALDFSKNRADGDDILGDAYEYLMRHFATESGKSKGQFYTPAEVSRVMARLVGIRDAKTTASTTVYDPTCGSGSLLLKVGDEARTPVTLYGQEKDGATSGLARMNMILHDYPTAEIAHGNTVADPKFMDGDALKTFDFVVANPPFSDKRWSTGIKPLDDPHQRFQPFGTPPERQGDYAYLLHIVRSLKSTARGACILPHGVLFRGNAEADIRRNLVRKGYIKGIVGLPANLFYGTGIPACIVVIDKAGAQARKGIFMIDASGGFMKDGPKNRLRSMDIHRIVDTFERRAEIPGYARMVPLEEIERNDFNLNLPRYIDGQVAEDVQDIAGHLQGGIPTADVDALERYWKVCPQLRQALFVDNRRGYVDLAVAKGDIGATIHGHPEFLAFTDSMSAHFDAWRKRSAASLKALQERCNPKQVIVELSEDLLAHYAGRPLIDAYDVYQHLMDYWAETMQDDCYIIADGGWKAETSRVIEKDKKGKERDKGWTCDLIPKRFIVARYFAAEQAAIDALAAELESTVARLAELEEEHGGEEGILRSVSSKADAKLARQDTVEAAWSELYPSSFKAYQTTLTSVRAATAQIALLENDARVQAMRNSKGKVTLAFIKKRISTSDDPSEVRLLEDYVEARRRVTDGRREASELLEASEQKLLFLSENDLDLDSVSELRALDQWLTLTEDEAQLKQRLKQAESDLDALAYSRYPKLTEAEVGTLVVDDKWLAALDSAVRGEMDRVSQQLTRRVRELAGRYEAPLPDMQRRADELEARVNRHLERMGFVWN